MVLPSKVAGSWEVSTTHLRGQATCEGILSRGPRSIISNSRHMTFNVRHSQWRGRHRSRRHRVSAHRCDEAFGQSAKYAADIGMT